MLLLRIILPVAALALLSYFIDSYSTEAVQSGLSSFLGIPENLTGILWSGMSILMLLGVATGLFLLNTKRAVMTARTVIPGALFLLLVPKLITCFALSGEDITRAFRFYLGLSDSFPLRSTWWTIAALITGFSFPILIIHGMLFNVYRYRVHHHKIKVKDLHRDLENFKIVQFSDAHLGSLTNVAAVQKGMDLMNAQNPDLIVFTGDLVNNLYTEALPFKDALASLKANYGVYSILGNHDYGDYVYWTSAIDKKTNLDELVQLQEELGWDLLLDENRSIKVNNAKIDLVGVHNISGMPQFRSYGNLSNAMPRKSAADFTLLLSHDPTHWDAEVIKKYPEIDLTLSGHTHAWQFGIEIGKFRWSPSALVFKRWADLYQEGTQYLNVNRGFGVLGYPGRVGIMPEVTVLELVKE